MRSVLYHPSDEESGSSVSLCDAPGLAPACQMPCLALSVCQGIVLLVLTPSIFQTFSELQLPRVELLFPNRTNRAFLVLVYTTLYWFLSSLLCLSESELLIVFRLGDNLLHLHCFFLSHLPRSFTMGASYHILMASSSQNKISFG